MIALFYKSNCQLTIFSKGFIIYVLQGPTSALATLPKNLNIIVKEFPVQEKIPA